LEEVPVLFYIIVVVFYIPTNSSQGL
jgi:hypothetical protein